MTDQSQWIEILRSPMKGNSAVSISFMNRWPMQSDIDLLIELLHVLRDVAAPDPPAGPPDRYKPWLGEWR